MLTGWGGAVRDPGASAQDQMGLRCMCYNPCLWTRRPNQRRGQQIASTDRAASSSAGKTWSAGGIPRAAADVLTREGHAAQGINHKPECRTRIEHAMKDTGDARLTRAEDRRPENMVLFLYTADAADATD